MSQSKKRRLFLFFSLLFSAVLLSQQPTTVRADARCGAGYACWPENGGEAVLYADCVPSNDGTYCRGTGSRAEYCSCEGSADCSCQIGPGTECGTPTGYATIGCCYGDSSDSGTGSVCGDGICDPNETCGSCEIDCGNCLVWFDVTCIPIQANDNILFG